MSRCPHHWTVTSECPKCLRAQLDGEVLTLTAKVAHLRAVLKDAQAALRVSDPEVIRAADDLIDQTLSEVRS